MAKAKDSMIKVDSKARAMQKVAKPKDGGATTTATTSIISMPNVLPLDLINRLESSLNHEYDN